MVSRSGKPDESWEEPDAGSSRVDPVRLAASHRSRKGGRVGRQKRKGVTALVPARKHESSRFVPARRKQLQKSTGDAWSRRSSSNALQKGRQGRVNGDLDRRSPRRSDVEGYAEIRNGESPPRIASDITERNWEKAQGDVRASSSGTSHRRKALRTIAGPGL